MRLRPAFEWASYLDDKLSLADHKKAFEEMAGRCIWAVRTVSGITTRDLARHVGVSQPAITKLEQSEAAGTISIGKLQEIARALDCELVYGFVPNEPLVKMADRVQQKQDAARRAKRKIPRPL